MLLSKAGARTAPDTNPMRQSLPACCARAASGHAATAPPRSVMKLRRFMSGMGTSSPPIAQGRDAQRPEFAVGLRYEHSSDGVRSIGLLPERKRQFAKPPLHPIRLDVREFLSVHTRRAPVGAALGIGVRQDVLAA